MKYSIISWAFAALLFAGCNNQNNNAHTHDEEDAHEHTDGTHVHEDGTVHEDHTDTTHLQEEFKVANDSTAVHEEHEDGHENDNHKH